MVVAARLRLVWNLLRLGVDNGDVIRQLPGGMLGSLLGICALSEEHVCEYLVPGSACPVERRPVVVVRALISCVVISVLFSSFFTK